MLSEEDKAIENAKWGLGIAAVIGLYHLLGSCLVASSFLFSGGLFMARKIFKK